MRSSIAGKSYNKMMRAAVAKTTEGLEQRLKNWQQLAERQSQYIKRMVSIIKHCPKCHQAWMEDLYGHDRKAIK